MTVETLLQTEWNEPQGIAPRGTVVVVGGRAENAAVYQRFGRRIAFDAYRVRFVEGNLSDLDQVSRDIHAVLTDPATVLPTLLLGSDTGAALALDHVARRTDLEQPDAVAVAGLAFPDDDTASFDDELVVRTACPNHRGVLGREGVNHVLVPADVHVARPGAASIDVPLLVVHGAADEVSPVAAVRDVALDIGAHTEVVTIEGGLHDILNDVTHRTVAATVIRFLERLKRGAALEPIATEERWDR